MSSAQTDAPFLVPSVKNLRNGKTHLTNVMGEFFHVDEEFHFAFAVAKECAEEVTHSFFRIIQSAG